MLEVERTMMPKEVAADAHGTQVKDFEDRDKNDAERGRAVRGHKAGRDHVERDKDQRDDRAGETEVEAGIEEMLLVFEQAEFDPDWDFLPADFGELDQASDVEKRLQHEKEQER